MKYCSNCGKLISDEANFCSYCGANVANVASIGSYEIEPEDLDYGYRVILYSKGTCTLKTAKEVLSDLLGYSLSTAGELLEYCPVEIADELTQAQAVTIGQALAEYGMEVTIVDENNTYVDLSDKVTSSVFTSTGALVTGALAILASLSAANRVHSYRKYKKPSLLELIFKPKYIKPKTQPVHIRRTVNPRPEPSRRISVNPGPAHQKQTFRQPSMHVEPNPKKKNSNTPKSSGKKNAPKVNHRH